MTMAAVVAAAILACLCVFQFALALGAPYGRFAWGGAHRVLPRRLRIGSLVTMVVYAMCAVLLLDSAGVIDVLANDELVRIATWALVVLFGIGTLMNLASRSADERRVMTPVALVLCLLSLVVALGV
jgi:hypothetical protein